MTDDQAARASHARFECPGCGEVELYAITPKDAAEVVRRHLKCNKRKKRTGKRKWFAGIRLFS